VTHFVSPGTSLASFFPSVNFAGYVCDCDVQNSERTGMLPARIDITAFVPKTLPEMQVQLPTLQYVATRLTDVNCKQQLNNEYRYNYLRISHSVTNF